MSTSSTRSKGLNRRINSLQSHDTSSRDSSRPRKRIVTTDDAYTYALRVAYLAYLLQPKAWRMQHVPAPPAPLHRLSTTSINDLMKDFTLLKDSKSTRFPHGFMMELEKRLTGVLIGKEKKPEYNDATIKRTFAAFLNAFTEQSFRKRMEKDRRVEDLVLIFFSNATKELQKGKTPGDDGWKLMVDRHLALFIRLISLVLKDHDWVRDRPDLTNRLSTLESKLLAHDQDLAASTSRNGGAGGSTIEVVVPLSYDVKDMPLVQHLARIFNLTNAQIQSDINRHKPIWTEKAALQDLKTYQTYLNLNSRRTLRNDDFDLDESYEAWKKAEFHDLSQMMLAIVQSNPELAKSTPGTNPLHFRRSSANLDAFDIAYPDNSRMADSPDASPYVIDQPVDMSFLNSINEISDTSSEDGEIFTYIPLDPRPYYRYILAKTLTHDLKNPDVRPSEGVDTPLTNFFSKQSSELLNEISLRWRIPQTSKTVLFLDVIREKFVDQDVTLEILDAAFNFVKEPYQDSPTSSLFFDRAKWPLADITTHQQLLSALHEALLRDLFDPMLHCYDQNPPTIGPTMYVLENHIQDDPGFPKGSEDLKAFSQQLYDRLKDKAHDVYRTLLEKEVPQDEYSWEFFHVIQLGKAVIAIIQRIQKRYRKNPKILGYVRTLALELLERF